LAGAEEEKTPLGFRLSFSIFSSFLCVLFLVVSLLFGLVLVFGFWCFCWVGWETLLFWLWKSWLVFCLAVFGWGVVLEGELCGFSLFGLFF